MPLSLNAAIISTSLLIEQFNEVDLSSFKTQLLTQLNLKNEVELISKFLVLFCNHSGNIHVTNHITSKINCLFQEATKILTNSNYPLQHPSNQLSSLSSNVIQYIGLFFNRNDCINYSLINRQIYTQIQNTSFLNLQHSYRSQSSETWQITEKMLQQLSNSHLKTPIGYSHLFCRNLCFAKPLARTWSEYSESLVQLVVGDKKLYFEGLFESINRLEIGKECLHVLSWIPIDILFGKRNYNINDNGQEQEKDKLHFSGEKEDKIELLSIDLLQATSNNDFHRADAILSQFGQNYAQLKNGNNKKKSVGGVRQLDTLSISSNSIPLTFLQKMNGNFDHFIIQDSRQAVYVNEEVISDKNAIFHPNLQSLTINTAKGISFSNPLLNDRKNKRRGLGRGNYKVIENNCPKFEKLSLRCTNQQQDDKYQSNLWQCMTRFNLCQNINHLIITDMYYKHNIDQFLDSQNGWLNTQMIFHNTNIKKITMQLTKDSTQWTALSLTNCTYIMQHLIYLRHKLINIKNNKNSKKNGGLLSGLKFISKKKKNSNSNTESKHSNDCQPLETIEIEWKIQEKKLQWKPMELDNNSLISSWIKLQHQAKNRKTGNSKDGITIMPEFMTNDGLDTAIAVETDLTVQSLHKIYYNMCMWMEKIAKQHCDHQSSKAFCATLQLNLIM